MTYEVTLRGLYRAIEEGDATAVAAYWHPEAEQIEYPSLMRPEGHRRPLQEMLEGFALGGQIIERQAYEVVGMVEDGDRAAVQLTWTAVLATDVGDLPAGHRLVSHVAAFYEFRDGLVLRQSSYDCYEPLSA